MKIKEVTVFAAGDSSKISTWSNVPYFFTETLISKNIKVNRVDLGPGFWGKVINRTVLRAFHFLHPGSTFDYSRSLAHEYAVKRLIRRVVKRHPTADLNIFLTFSFSSEGIGTQPVVLFGDWTYDHLLRHFHDRAPDRMEQAAIERENRAIESADCVFALFPAVAEQMKRRYQNRNIFYAGNVVNSLVTADEGEVVARKLRSMNLLFIGSKKYQEGAHHLLRAYSALKPRYPGLSVSIVGMKEKDFGALPEGARCFGYLDKGDTTQRELYYSLLLDARVIVNTTPKWGAFSAMLEAMYFYNPVIVTPYQEFVETFGNAPAFGTYCEGEASETLCDCIEALLSDDGYRERCVSAHDAVKQYTWSAYIDRLLSRVGSAVQAGPEQSALSECVT